MLIISVLVFLICVISVEASNDEFILANHFPKKHVDQSLVNIVLQSHRSRLPQLCLTVDGIITLLKAEEYADVSDAIELISLENNGLQIFLDTLAIKTSTREIAGHLIELMSYLHSGKRPAIYTHIFMHIPWKDAKAIMRSNDETRHICDAVGYMMSKAIIFGMIKLARHLYEVMKEDDGKLFSSTSHAIKNLITTNGNDREILKYLLLVTFAVDNEGSFSMLVIRLIANCARKPSILLRFRLATLFKYHFLLRETFPVFVSKICAQINVAPHFVNTSINALFSQLKRDEAYYLMSKLKPNYQSVILYVLIGQSKQTNLKEAWPRLALKLQGRNSQHEMWPNEHSERYLMTVGKVLRMPLILHMLIAEYVFYRSI